MFCRSLQIQSALQVPDLGFQPLQLVPVNHGVIIWLDARLQIQDLFNTEHNNHLILGFPKSATKQFFGSTMLADTVWRFKDKHSQATFLLKLMMLHGQTQKCIWEFSRFFPILIRPLIYLRSHGCTVACILRAQWSHVNPMLIGYQKRSWKSQMVNVIMTSSPIECQLV